MTQQFPQQQPQGPWQQQPQQQPHQPPRPPKKPVSPWVWIGGLVAVGVLLFGAAVGAGAMIGASGKDSARTTAAAARTTTTTSASDAEASAAAESLLAVEAAARQDETRYEQLDDRQWKVIARNPNAYKGKWYRIYGVVRQSDAATGTAAVRMSTEGTLQDESYEYTVNTVVIEGGASLSEIVEDDELKMFVEVAGSITYDTTLGGKQTAPKVKAHKIVRLV